ncbi:MAG: GxxExxY protein, partial [Pirellulales bacterium]|nr:GxxExxY protein [Pirellulales bacterium]
MKQNGIGTLVIEAAITIHRELGPGLLETVYEVVLARELADRGLKVDRQVPVPIPYKRILRRAMIWDWLALELVNVCQHFGNGCVGLVRNRLIDIHFFIEELGEWLALYDGDIVFQRESSDA